MSEWCYRATVSKVSLAATTDLAMNYGFLYRCAYEANGSRVDNSTKVEFGDLIHLFFIEDGEGKLIGTFEVVGPLSNAIKN